ncbi:VOC family protein [Candidatus Pacearchaeota archaeon]|nr:VOC family protein [Candidatus Pacearchaeota archaeon]
MDKVMHFEIPADDPQRAQKFYSSAFGWKANSMPNMGYTIFHTGPTDKQGMVQEKGFINGGMLKRQDCIQSPIITIVVDNMKEAIERVKKAKGHIIRDAEKVGEAGIAAYFKDTEGNVMGLWEPLMRPGQQ